MCCSTNQQINLSPLQGSGLQPRLRRASPFAWIYRPCRAMVPGYFLDCYISDHLIRAYPALKETAYSAARTSYERLHPSVVCRSITSGVGIFRHHISDRCIVAFSPEMVTTNSSRVNPCAMEYQYTQSPEGATANSAG